jgi:hypothetical protein
MARASSRGMQRGVEVEENLLIAQEVRSWHGEAVPARPRWHHPGEGADDTSARHHTHQHQISPRGKPSSSRWSSRPPWPRSRAQEATETRAPGGNQPDILDRQERHREIYRLLPISAANSGRGRRNQAWRRRGDAVARARARGTREVSEASGRVGLTEPPGRVRPGGPGPTGGPGWQVGLGRFLTSKKTENYKGN